MKKVISFDLDGTLVNAGYGDMVWNHGIPVEYSKKYNIPFHEAKALIRGQYESVGDGDLLWYEIDYWLEKFHLSVTSEELLKRYESQIEPLTYAGEVLEKLDEKYTLVIASNAARCFIEKELDYTGFRQYFTHIVSATTDYKMVKKEEGFYRKLCERLQIMPSDIVHVGDTRFSIMILLQVSVLSLTIWQASGPMIVTVYRISMGDRPSRVSESFWSYYEKVPSMQN
jgi:putative hydrolase of the HAD superfamily